ncbi:hypothetical protein O181_081160 [Austropuccinia psidii MF-1]|uniref:Uncharacterized protein n=1 Tax=Austropuccinia psidii MF-1 TaxID=1389203 RepID=A0A9Q3FPJ8_9BASI|nr:hypothetical protein [Austropuccinia psidii MF-1]
MSKEDQINLMSYFNLFTSLKNLFKIQYPWNPYVQSVSRALTDLYLILVLRSSPFKVGGVLSQPQIITLLNGCCGNSILTQVRANWPYHIIYAQLAPSSALWPLGYLTSSLAIYGLRPYTAFIGPLGQLPTSPTPRPLPLFLGLGVLSIFQGPMAPLATTRALGPTPYISTVLA